MPYQTIISVQGDDYAPFERELYPGSTEDELRKGFLMGSPDKRSAARYLAEWDHGDPSEEFQGPGRPWGTSDDVTWFNTGLDWSGDEPSEGYALVYHTGLSYAVLYRIIPGHSEYPHEEGFFDACSACVDGDCVCGPTTSECVSHVHGDL